MCTPGPCWLVFLNEDELARLQTCPAFLRGVSRPLGRILAGGLAVVVGTREIEVAVHPYRNQCFVGLKRDAVGVYRIELIGDRAVGTRGNEVADGLHCAQLTEEEGFLDGLHNEKDLGLNFSTTIGKLRAKLFDHSLELGLDAFGSFTAPSTGICEEIADDGVSGVEAVGIFDTVEDGHSLQVGCGIGGNFGPVLADFAGDGVERSCHNSDFF